ncbi:serine/threonine protein kinase [Babesia caballi]|uniref:Serine/threonine protein kinase n=1 Tax=Babesia caballi TaxID=5871 RepID=A0AAV4LZM0_BABCB|nr:serine/threonine protein kinase [Babesia caballi]
MPRASRIQRASVDVPKTGKFGSPGGSFIGGRKHVWLGEDGVEKLFGGFDSTLNKQNTIHSSDGNGQGFVGLVCVFWLLSSEDVKLALLFVSKNFVDTLETSYCF